MQDIIEKYEKDFINENNTQKYFRYLINYLDDFFTVKNNLTQNQYKKFKFITKKDIEKINNKVK